MSENIEKQISCSPGTQEPAAMPQPVIPSGRDATRGIIVPVPLAGLGGPRADTRPDWSTVMLRGSYHPSTMALVSRAKVRKVFLPKYNITPLMLTTNPVFSA